MQGNESRLIVSSLMLCATYTEYYLEYFSLLNNASTRLVYAAWIRCNISQTYWGLWFCSCGRAFTRESITKDRKVRTIFRWWWSIACWLRNVTPEKTRVPYCNAQMFNLVPCYAYSSSMQYLKNLILRIKTNYNQ